MPVRHEARRSGLVSDRAGKRVHAAGRNLHGVVVRPFRSTVYQCGSARWTTAFVGWGFERRGGLLYSVWG